MLAGPLALAAFVLATQTPPLAGCGVPGLDDTRAKFELVDSSGATHKASLVRIDGAAVLLRARGQVVAVPCAELERRERPADRRWDGALIGFGAGLGLAALVAVGSAGASLYDPNGQYHEPIAAELAIMAAFTGIGYWIDSVHGGKHTVFLGKMPAAAAHPSGLTLEVTGSAHHQQLNVGYRVTF